ncbi:choice-of-anchor A domain-containing protein [Saccharothrix saharensis]|uniref:Choice-of-anchor A domain-containing protein n=1 Tax=Saccharothrix saharensis TaxID=571190 RepID=A0A543JII8_9PSEU|nr:choice-of-anchor A family protein [Saccharothrix saharensis]TQM82690.1 choice-of-anchor A domain-containing protein [Saccharothrix saharensis]
MQISRIGAAGLAVVVAVLAIGWASGAPARLAMSVNPVRPVAPDDVYLDPSHGFLVLVEGDAALYENETEGPVAVGGDVRFRQYNAGLNHAGTYVLPGDTRPTSFVVGGAIDFAGSTGTLSVLNNSYAKIGDLSQSDVHPSGGVTWVEPDGAAPGSTPGVSIQTAQTAESVAGASGFDFASLFTTYRSLNAEMATCPSTVALTDQNGQNPWNGTDPNATIGLQPGQNVLTLTPAQMTALDNINPRNGYLQPSDQAWLVINVDVAGDYTWDVPNVSWQGNEPSRHVLWNFTTSGTITLPENSPTVWGTIYAPHATLVDLSAANIEGAVVVKSLVHGGETGGSGGEIHYAPFDNVVTCTTTTTTTTPTTTTTTTTGPTTTTGSPTTTQPTTTTGGPTTTTAAPTTTASSTGGTTSHPAVVHPGDDELAATGTPIRGTLALGGLLLLAGATALTLSRLRDRRG